MKKSLWFLLAVLASPIIPFLKEETENNLLAKAGR